MRKKRAKKNEEQNVANNEGVVQAQEELPTPPTCRNCAYELPEDAAFCPSCGLPIKNSKKKELSEKKQQKAVERGRKRIAGEDSILITNDLVGLEMMYESGIAETLPGHFVRTAEFGDISYEGERKEQQDFIFEVLHQLHGYFPANSVYQLTLTNIPTTVTKLERYLPEVGANADLARCFNTIIENQLREGRVGFERRNYISWATDAADYDTATSTLASMRSSIEKFFNRMNASFEVLDGKNYLHTLHDITRGPSEPFYFDYENLRHSKERARDALSYAWAAYPQEDNFLRRYIQFPTGCVQALRIRDFGSDLSDRAIRSIRALKVPMVISLLFVPQIKRQVVRDIRGNIAAIQGEIYEYQGQVARGYGDITRLPPHMEEREQESKELLDFVVDKDQDVSWFQGLILVFAPNPTQLARNVQAIIDEAGVWSIDVEGLALRQEEAFKSALPLATTYLPKLFRSLTTAESAIMVPFSSESVRHDPHLSYYLGQDRVTNDPIFVNPQLGKSPHMWIMGITGAGKGMCMNSILTFSALNYPRTEFDEATNSFVSPDPLTPSWFIFDFHGEYSALVERLGGRVDKLGATSDVCLNPLDISNEAGVLTEKAIAKNNDFFLALMQSIMGDALSQVEKSTIDRCLNNILHPHVGSETRPVLGDLYNELLAQNTETATNLAVALETYVTGSLKAFNGQTNIEQSDYIESFDCSELGNNMQTFALLTAMQHVKQRTFANYRQGRPTYLVIEEVQCLFDNDKAVELLDSFFSEMRKYNLRIICVTQVPSRVLTHPRARYLFNNSGNFVFLGNHGNDVDLIGELFRLSRSQKECMDVNNEKGSGLVIAGGTKVGMKNPIPEGNILYELWNTDPDRMIHIAATEGAKDAENPVMLSFEDPSQFAVSLRFTAEDGKIFDKKLTSTESLHILDYLAESLAAEDGAEKQASEEHEPVSYEEEQIHEEHKAVSYEEEQVSEEYGPINYEKAVLN